METETLSVVESQGPKQAILTGKKQFFLVWSPQGPTPPKNVYGTHGHALKIAATMHSKYPDQDFFVCKAKTVFRGGAEKYMNLAKLPKNNGKKKVTTRSTDLTLA
jgi:hypothetical protein